MRWRSVKLSEGKKSKKRKEGENGNSGGAWGEWWMLLEARTWTWSFCAVLPLGRQVARIQVSHSRPWSHWRRAPPPSAGYLWCIWRWCWVLWWEQGWVGWGELVALHDLWRAKRPHLLKVMGLYNGAKISVIGNSSLKTFQEMAMIFCPLWVVLRNWCDLWSLISILENCS